MAEDDAHMDLHLYEGKADGRQLGRQERFDDNCLDLTYFWPTHERGPVEKASELSLIASVSLAHLCRQFVSHCREWIIACERTFPAQRRQDAQIRLTGCVGSSQTWLR